MANQNFDPNNNIKNRELRVFVSSTFLDMQDERQYLAETVFPSVKKYCQELGVDFIPLDLRWGVTKFQETTGKTMEVCLETIQTCNVFLGLIGYRYGSKPKLIDFKRNPKMRKGFPLLEDDVKNHLSMTEIEMQYGVLRDPKQRYSCFCFRSEIMQSEIEKRGTFEGEAPSDKEKLTRLKDEIKSKKNYDSVFVNEYDSVEEMGAMVESFLKKDVVDKLFPAKTTWYERQMVQQDFFIERKQKLYVPRLDYYEIINDFMDSPSKYFAITGERGNGKSSLVANWMGTRPDLKFIYCFVGASENSFNPEDILKLLIAQLNPDAVKDGEEDWKIMLELESENKPKGKEDQPENWYDKYHAIFRRTLLERHKANPDERIVLILDGINQIFDYQNSKELQWIPKLSQYQYVKAVFTTWEDDRTNDSLKALGAKTMNVEPLNKEQIREIVEKYWKDRGRKLNKWHIDRIVNDKESQSPVVLRTLLDEMCYYGEHKKLLNYIDSFVNTVSKEDFFARVLKRLEDSYGSSKVSGALTALFASHSGLSNEELIGIVNCQIEAARQLQTKTSRHLIDKMLEKFIKIFLKSDDGNFSLFNWKQISYSLDSHFIERGGRNYFSHDLIASAAENRYEANIPNVRSLIVEYMKSSGSVERQCDEIPWQLSQLEDWAGLNEFLLNPDVLKCMLDKSDFNLYLWNLYDNGNSLDEYFTLDLSRLIPDHRVKIYHALAAFGGLINNVRISERGLTEALNVLRNNRDSFEDKERYESHLATTLYNLGTVHHYSDKNQAEKEYSEALDISRRLHQEKPEEYAGMLNDLGLLHLEMRRFEQSEEELSEALNIYGNCFKDHPDEWEARYFYTMPLLNRGLLYMERKSSLYYSKAESDFRDGLGILQELNKESPGFYDEDIARTKMNLGFLYFNWSDRSKAESYLTDAFTSFSLLEKEKPDFYNFELGMTNLNLGLVYMQMNCDLDAAKDCWNKALDYFQKQNKQNPGSCDDKIAKVNLDLGLLYIQMNDCPKSKNCLTDALNSFLRLNEENSGIYNWELGLTHLNLGLMHMQTNPDSESDIEAEANFHKALEYLKKWNDVNPGSCDEDLAKTLMHLGRLYLSTDRFSEAEAALCDSLKLNRRFVDDNPAVFNEVFTATLALRGAYYLQEERYPEAVQDYLEALKGFRSLTENNLEKFDEQIVDVQQELALAYFRLDCPEKAVVYLTDALNTFRRLNKKNPGVYNQDYIGTLVMRADYYSQVERYSEAEKDLLEALSIEQDKKGIALLYSMLGRLFYSIERYSEAEDNYNKAMDIFRQLAVNNPDAYNPAIADVLSELARTHLNQNRESEAKDELNEAVNICRGLNESEDSLMFVAGRFFTSAHIYKERLYDYSRCKELLLESRAAYEKLNELHPGEFEDQLNAVRDSLKYLEEENSSSNKD